MIDLDATDRAILAELQHDGRMTVAELAERIHLSSSAVLRRMRRLETAGVIDRYVMLVDRHAIGRPTSVFVEISLTSQHEDLLDEFEAAVGSCPEVMSCHLMSGQYDYLLHVAVADVADYERVHRSHLAVLPGVAQLRSSFALRTVLDKTAYELAAP
ncbi:MAG: Lrp/AsnC family transcriptional regulator [Acidimicrobiia bacterium]|nr:Lrp/AsnC family transcriptional regulator [Acidimicrobiia bacterium]